MKQLPGGELEREIKMVPAYDRRHPDPKHDYGVHGLELRFRLKGPAGVAEVIIFTNWMLRSTYEWWDTDPKIKALRPLNRPQAAEIGFHSRNLAAAAERVGFCDLFADRDVCYYSSFGARQADAVLQILIEQGEDAVWERMGEVYQDGANA